MAVDIDTGEVRLRRMLGVFAAGRILNPKTARSQVIGGMIWGVGTALNEETASTSASAASSTTTSPATMCPVHADIADLDAFFLPEVDDKSNPLKSKGVGELPASAAPARRSPTRSTTPAGCACATTRSRWTSWSSTRPSRRLSDRAGKTSGAKPAPVGGRRESVLDAAVSEVGHWSLRFVVTDRAKAGTSAASDRVDVNRRGLR